MADVSTVIASVAASSAVAAVVTGVIARLNERRRQLRERSLIVAGDFAGGAMDVLAQLRHYRPSKGRGHRNDVLHDDVDLLRRRAGAVTSSLDALRPLRGRVWMFFPGRSTVDTIRSHGPQTIADWAEDVVACLQSMLNVCDKFWRDSAQTETWEVLEGTATEDYRIARTAAWRAIDQFAVTGAKRV
ncbi:MAG: hypothetical protein JWR20_181 [Marmoricola sp.]|nr:hypothetical protein [Marmoricola sp.]